MCCKFLSRNHRIVCSDKSARSSYESGEIICRLVVEQRGLHHTDALKDALPSIPPLKRIAEKGPRMMGLVMIVMDGQPGESSKKGSFCGQASRKGGGVSPLGPDHIMNLLKANVKILTYFCIEI